MPDSIQVPDFLVVPDLLDGDILYVIRAGVDKRILGSTIKAAISWGGLSGKPTTLAGFGITDAQPFDADLAAIAGLTTQGFGRSLLTTASDSAARLVLGLSNSNNVAFLTVAAVAVLAAQFEFYHGSGFSHIIQTADNATTNRMVIFTFPNSDVALTFPASGTLATTAGVAAGYQPLDSDLTSWAALTRAAALDVFVVTPTLANLNALVSDADVAVLAGNTFTARQVMPGVTLSQTATTNALDFSSNDVQTITLSGNTTFTTSNLAAGRSKTVIITCDGSTRTLTFPAWVFVGSAAPANIAASKKAVLTISATGATDAGCVAAYAVQP